MSFPVHKTKLSPKCVNAQTLSFVACSVHFPLLYLLHFSKPLPCFPPPLTRKMSNNYQKPTRAITFSILSQTCSILSLHTLHLLLLVLQLLLAFLFLSLIFLILPRNVLLLHFLLLILLFLLFLLFFSLSFTFQSGDMVVVK